MLTETLHNFLAQPDEELEENEISPTGFPPRSLLFGSQHNRSRSNSINSQESTAVNPPRELGNPSQSRTFDSPTRSEIEERRSEQLPPLDIRQTHSQAGN